ncbi:hypothetical protein PMI38_03907 [Pseudomonas sp. GM84]|uniref:hypothetical protein n=1 Tax=Pseudomonas sp. GM84 TaxID=1144340 RepID=UPI00026F8275|nr:hypothetical protein [Pseudomonas sp. GM84]EJN36661.1 hypothetical protein PMI38_03907 [Pseudomonas sp. GM84]
MKNGLALGEAAAWDFYGGYLTSLSKEATKWLEKGISKFVSGQLRLSAVRSIIAQASDFSEVSDERPNPVQ